MNKKEKVDDIYQKTKNLINSESSKNFYVYINKTNNYINITDKINQGRSLGMWLPEENDILYGPYSYVEAIAHATIFSNLYHIDYRVSWGIKTTNKNNLKAF